MYVPKNFGPEELIPPEVYNEFSARGNINRIYQILFDDRILMALQACRDQFGPLIVNNWEGKTGPAANDVFRYRGFRPATLTGVGSGWSQHKFGRAIDFHSPTVPAEEIRKWILRNHSRPGFNFIRALEKDIAWVHIDCRNYDDTGIFLFTS